MRSARIAAAAALLPPFAACDIQDTRLAHGEVNSIIVVAVDSLWDAAGDSIEAALEPRIFTVRDEKSFELTHVSPLSEDWLNLRLFKQVLVIGTPGDGWIEPVLEGRDAPVEAPATVERRNVWARGQLVTAIVVPPNAGADAVMDQLPGVAVLLDERYRAYARARMYVSGADSALADTLAATRGYRMVLPRIYDRQVLDGADVFRNHAEMGGVLLRTILVTWRPGVEPEPEPEKLLAWRDSAAAVAYDPGQTVERDRIETHAMELDGRQALELQGIWTSVDTSWPAAGPFMIRAVPCPRQDRTYYLDAWLYAPGKSKYEYMIQLQTLLDTFRCGADAGRKSVALAGAS